MFVRTARLSSGTVRYLEAGTGAPLVLLHAFPLAADQWLPQLMAAPAGWRFIAPDLRGFGGTPPAADRTSVTIDTYAADVFELLTQLELEQTAVAGLSMGGYVALAMMASNPSRISRLVLADTRANADNAEGLAGRDRMVSLVRREGPAGVAREMLPKLLGATSARQQPDLATVVTRLIEGNGPDGIEAAILAMKDRPDRSALLSTITCPTVVICGDDDVITKPEECEAMSRAIPGARFVRIDGAAHLSNLEQSVAFSAALT